MNIIRLQLGMPPLTAAATFLALSCFIAGSSLAEDLSVLDRHYVSGKFRIFYTVDGKSAVPAADRDSSGVPDHIEDVAKQLTAAHRLFCEVLQFTDPLNCERYSDVQCIQVSIRERTELNIGNGVAFDESQRAKNIPEGKPDDRTLVIAIGNHIDPTKNVSAAHEFFHLIQYASTYFKSRWFLEGQARWSEHALDPDGLGESRYSPRGPWPQNARQLSELVKMDYDAEYVLWNPIAEATDRKGLLPQTPEVREIASVRYSDGSPVLRDVNLTGAKFMREVLLELGKMDDIAFQKLGYDDWSESNQRSIRNDPYIYEAVMDVLRSYSRTVRPFSAQLLQQRN